jgi:hypothetical protein
MNLGPDETKQVGSFLVDLADFEAGLLIPMYALQSLEALSTRELGAVTKIINPKRIDNLKYARDQK